MIYLETVNIKHKYI